MSADPGPAISGLFFFCFCTCFSEVLVLVNVTVSFCSLPKIWRVPNTVCLLVGAYFRKRNQTRNVFLKFYVSNIYMSSVFESFQVNNSTWFSLFSFWVEQCQKKMLRCFYLAFRSLKVTSYLPKCSWLWFCFSFSSHSIVVTRKRHMNLQCL